MEYKLHISIAERQEWIQEILEINEYCRKIRVSKPFKYPQ